MYDKIHYKLKKKKKKVHARDEHTTSVLAGSVPLRCWETRESWSGRRGAALFSSEERVDGKESRAATSPAAHWLFAGSLCPGINSPGEPASLLNLNVLENWNDCQVATWGVSRSPREVNLAGERLSPTAALTPGRTMEPHSEKSTVTQRSPPQLQTPDIWALTFICRHRVFQDRVHAGCLPRSPCPVAHIIVRSKCSHWRKHMISSKHNQCRQDFVQSSIFIYEVRKFYQFHRWNMKLFFHI